ncbi:MAG TPA: multiheme c-type cytochrome, partial [Stenomitos sp.]
MPTPRHRRWVIIGALIAGASTLGLLGCTAALNPLHLGSNTNAVTATAKTGFVAVGVAMPSAKREIAAIQDQIDHISISVAPAQGDAWSALTASFSKASLGTTSWRTFSAVPVGNVYVTANAYNASNTLMKTVRSDELTVTAGQVTNATLELKWDVGGVSAQINVSVGSPIGLTPGTMGASQDTAVAVGGASQQTDAVSATPTTLSANAYSCGTCHSDIQAVFQTAAHNVWEGTHLSSSCFPCHTTVADPKTGSNLLNKNGELVAFDYTKATANDSHNWGYLGVQCEACHGAGSNHVAVDTKSPTSVQDHLDSITRVPSSTGTCLNCHMDKYNKVGFMAQQPGTTGYILPSFPTYMVSKEDVNASGYGAFLRHGKQSEIYLGGGGYMYDARTPDYKATTGTAANFPASPYKSTFNPHRDSVSNGCVTCHMNPADPKAHDPSIAKKRDEVAQASCQTCHGTGFTGSSIESYINKTERDLDSLAAAMVNYRTTKAKEILWPIGSTTYRVHPTDAASWSIAVASTSFAVSCWDDSP